MSDKELFDLGETYLFKGLDPGRIDFIKKKAVLKKLNRKEYISYSEDMDVIFILSEILGKDPLIARRLIVILGRILKQTNEVIKNLAFEEVGVRLARFILDQGEEYGIEKENQTVIKMELTHEDIAALTATSRQTVTSILGRMEKDRIISTQKKKTHHNQ
ncbi:MAG: Crp/Fnr family transcriptional regulator [Peptococcaceae bacterium]|nr:Crp/Fnr family transcriptional regulator [Peptococcaceae bacterium]